MCIAICQGEPSPRASKAARASSTGSLATMCGRYAASRGAEELVEIFAIDEVVESVRPAYNVAPTDQVAAVVERAADSGQVVRKLIAPKWGLVPSWSKDPSGGARMINARFETVAEKPAFRRAFAARRCLLPADGYYEWYETQRLNSSGKPVKQPFFIHRADRAPLAMAGLYEFWRDESRGAEAPWLTTCTIITTTATDKLGHIHDRMPMIVRPEKWDAWLDPGQTRAADLLGLLAVTDADDLEAYAVSTLVNKVDNDSPQLIEPVAAS